MEDYKNNSTVAAGLASPQKEKQTPVTTNVIVKDNNKFLRKIFANDAKSTAKTVTNDVLIPGTKNLIVNVLKRAIDFLFNGTYTPSTLNRFNYYDAYSSIPTRSVTYSTSTIGPGVVTPVQRSAIYSVNEVIFPERGPAEETLFRMQEIINKYGMVSVLDFYDLIGQKTTTQQNKYGWKDLSMATVSSIGEGYHINFPRVVPLE